jgi:hypothetical protein
MQNQPWIYSRIFDGIFIVGVPFFIVAAALLLPATFGEPDSMTVVSWAILVMGVDVGHVYSTLYRTYLDPETHKLHRTFLYLLPFVVFVVCFALYGLGALTFWRVMAYLAVFHFARQQYGFMRVYARSENQSTWARRIDALTIYVATFYPIAEWHMAGQKNFNWFMKGDFVYLPEVGLVVSAVEPLRKYLFLLYLSVILTYFVKEAWHVWKSRTVNLPRNGILAGTFLSWYVGIVHFNSDLAFTAINVVSHGVPYMALVWIYGKKKYFPVSSAGVAPARNYEISRWSVLFKPRYVTLFLASLLILAYLEEGLWNAWVWHDKEHAAFFGIFHSALGSVDAGSPWLKIIVPLLSVPQITHYVIDGFIWKMRKDKYRWSDITLATLPAGGVKGVVQPPA